MYHTYEKKRNNKIHYFVRGLYANGCVSSSPPEMSQRIRATSRTMQRSGKGMVSPSSAPINRVSMLWIRSLQAHTSKSKLTGCGRRTRRAARTMPWPQSWTKPQSQWWRLLSPPFAGLLPCAASFPALTASHRSTKLHSSTTRRGNMGCRTHTSVRTKCA